MKDGYKTMIAKVNVLRQAQRVFQQQGEADMMQSVSEAGSPPLERRRSLTQSLLGEHAKIAYFGGLVNKKEVMSFKKLVFRATRGNAFTQFFNIEPDPEGIAYD